MNPFFLIFICLPAIEIYFMIKVGAEVGALNTIGLVFLTAIIGVYFAKLQGIQTLKSGMINLYQNKIPVYEVMSGASIALAALLLIVPGFFTDIIGFLLLIPFVRMRFNIQNVIFGLIIFIPALIGMLQTESAEWASNAYMKEGSAEAAGALFRLGILVLSGAYFLLKLAPYWRRDFPNDFKLVTIGSWMMVSFFLLFFVSSVIGDRFGYYLIPIQAMIFARIPYLSLGRFRQVHAAIPYIALTFVFVVWTMTSWHFSHCYTPYKFGL